MAAIGKPKFIDDSYVKEGAVVIDVGIHRKKIINYAEMWTLIKLSRLLLQYIILRSGRSRSYDDCNADENCVESKKLFGE